jgi:NADH:quinone reductase (non-electrogenic)
MAQRIVVLGAGYSGLVAAKLAARRTKASVTLVNATDLFVERVRLHQLASGQRLARLSIRDLLDRTGVTFVEDTVTGIDAAARAVTLARRDTAVRYDVLIYALGSRADLCSVPGVREHADTVADVAHAQRLCDRLRHSRSVTVVGGGFTGIEAAAEIAESYPNAAVHLATGGGFGAALSLRGRRYLGQAFHRLGVQVHEHAKVTEVDAGGVHFAEGDYLPSDTVVWTTGFEVPSIAADAGFAVNARGRMLVDSTLRSTSHPDVYGIGDAAAACRDTGQELRMACATGIPSAQHATKAIAERLAGREPKPLRFRFFNQCVSLGRRDGLIQFVRPDDSPVEAILTGRPAAAYKEAIVRSTVFAQRHPAVTVAA